MAAVISNIRTPKYSGLAGSLIDVTSVADFDRPAMGSDVDMDDEDGSDDDMVTARKTFALSPLRAVIIGVLLILINVVLVWVALVTFDERVDMWSIRVKTCLDMAALTNSCGSLWYRVLLRLLSQCSLA